MAESDGEVLYPVEPWQLREDRVDTARLARGESLFALANGWLGVRGTLDEGEPAGDPGTYLNSVHEVRPMPYAERGHGDPAEGQELVRVADGTRIRLLVDGEPLDVRQGRLRGHERVLDLRAGSLDRRFEWTSPGGRTVRVSSRRLVSLTRRALLAVSYEVEAVDGPVPVELHSELVAAGEPFEPLPPPGESCLAARLPGSGLHVVAGMDHLAADRVPLAVTADRDLVRATTGTVTLRPGRPLRLTKLVAYAWSTGPDGLPEDVAATLAAARAAGWDRLAAEQREFLEPYWERADVVVEGDDRLQQAVRFALFHVLQAAARAEGRPVPGKGLTGPGYSGHSFWDTEVFVLPVLTQVRPEAARDVLRWRHSILPQARDRARELRLAGAAFPWRTIDGRESSGYWPASTAAFHVNADIAHAALRYVETTGDTDFERSAGVDLLVETARLWLSLGFFGADGRFRIDGVTGPDEYSAVADNNVFTNLMAQQNLRAAASAAARHPGAASGLGVTAEEIAEWRAAADAMAVPYDEALGVHQQSEGFTAHARWDFGGTEDYPLMESFPYVELYRKQVVKQADLVLAMFLRGDAFTAAEKQRGFDYYEALTVRDSSLSASVQAILAAEVGHLELAYAYACEAALVDLHDLRDGVEDGLHVASLAGAWLALVAGFGGMRDCGGRLTFGPRLPEALDRLAFSIRRGAARIRVEVRSAAATYTLEGDAPLRIRHHGEEVELAPGVPWTGPIPPAPRLRPPTQPPGREPLNP